MIKLSEIKTNPKMLICKPWFLLWIPYLLILAYLKRLKTEAQSIFLTETVLYDHPLLQAVPSDELSLIKIDSFEDAEMFILKRVEESGLTQAYLSEVKSRFNNKDSLFVLSDNNQPVSFLFISEKEAFLNQVGYRLKLPDNCFAVYDVYTYRSSRSKGYYSMILTKVLKGMKAKGYNKLWLWVMNHNKVSVFVHDKLKINNVIATFTEYYRFGFRIFKKDDTRYKLNELFK